MLNLSRYLNEPRRTFSVPGFANSQLTPVHTASLSQLSAQSEDLPAPLVRDRRQASLLKVNLAKQSPQDGKITTQTEESCVDFKECT